MKKRSQFRCTGLLVKVVKATESCQKLPKTKTVQKTTYMWDSGYKG